MTDDRVEQAMNNLLDGTATPDESAWIRPLIAGNVELRRRYEELEEVHRLLGRAPRLDAPADLKSAILRAIETPAPARAAGENWLATLGRVFRQRQSVGYAYAFAGGLAVALLGLALLGRLSPSPQWQNLGQQSGTMVAPSGAGPRTVGRTAFEAGAARVTVESLADDAGVELRIGITAPGPVELEVGTDAAVLPLTAFEQSPRAGAAVDLQAGRVHWAGQGSQELTLHLERVAPGGTPLSIRISSGRETRIGTIDVGPLERR